MPVNQNLLYDMIIFNLELFINSKLTYSIIMDKESDNKARSYNRGRYIGEEQIKRFVLGLLFAVAITAVIGLWLCIDWAVLILLLLAFFIFTILIAAIIYKHQC